MTESEAQLWLADRGWWDGLPGERLRRFVDLVLEEADRQNLISAGSRQHIWARHIVDSAQLLELERAPTEEEGGGGRWVDLGAGAGFPGLVIGCLREGPVHLIEMRPLRAAFLERCVTELGLTNVIVASTKVEKVVLEEPAAIISARAYAPLDRLLASACHLADKNTLWLLPKGRTGEKELAIARKDWQAMFHVEHSVTDPESAILTIRNLEPRRAPREVVQPHVMRARRINNRKARRSP